MRTVMRYLARPVRNLVDATFLTYYGGIGDHLMLSTVARDLKRRGRRSVPIISDYPLAPMIRRYRIDPRMGPVTWRRPTGRVRPTYQSS